MQSSNPKALTIADEIEEQLQDDMIQEALAQVLKLCLSLGDQSYCIQHLATYTGRRPPPPCQADCGRSSSHDQRLDQRFHPRSSENDATLHV